MVSKGGKSHQESGFAHEQECRHQRYFAANPSP